MKHGIINVVTA